MARPALSSSRETDPEAGIISSPAIEKSAPRLAWSLVVFLFLVELAYVLMSAAAPDTARDILQAARICSGEILPLTGPDFDGQFRLGPYWFYLISPLACTQNPLLTVGLLVAVLSAAKYPLAYLVGRKLAGEKFALLWLPVLAVLSWPNTLMFYTHTNGLLSLLLLSAWVLLALSSTRTVLCAFLFGAITSLAINLHPSAFPFVILAVVPLWKAYRGKCFLACILVGLAGGLLPFLPVIIAMATDTGLAAKNSGFINILSGDALTRLPHYWWKVAAGPIDALTLTVAESGIQPSALWSIFAVVAGLTILGWFSLFSRSGTSAGTRQVFLLLLGLTLVFSLLVVPLRVYYPFYMLLICVLPFSALVALGLAQLNHRIHSVALVLTCLLTLIPLIAHVKANERGSTRAPFGKNYDVEDLFPVFDKLHFYIWTSAMGFRENSELICSLGTEHLHGYLPLQLNEGLGLMTRNCDEQRRREYQHVLSLPEFIAAQLDRPGDQYSGGHVLFNVSAESSDSDHPKYASDYPPYPEGDPIVQRTLSLRAPHDAYILLSNLYYFSPLEIKDLDLSSGQAELVYEDEFGKIFRCESCKGDEVLWDFTLTTGELSPLDLVAF